MQKIIGFVVLTLFWATNFASAQSHRSYDITLMASDLDQPWSIGFLPEGGWLVTLRGGTLRHYNENGQFTQVGGLPRIRARGQGGLFDVVVARDFAQSRTIFLSYAAKSRGTTGTVLASAKLHKNGRRLTDLVVLFKMTSPTSGGEHFGGRIVEAQDGTLFLTIGDRGDSETAQDTNNHNGALIRVNRDGSVPASNPKLWKLPEIWSYGHRNPQGAALDQDGQLYVHEHGARGGDEVNRVNKGANYGWPVIAYGRHYSGGKIGEGTHKAGMEQPELYWDPSIAPSGFAIHSGNNNQEWAGDFFVGSLKFNYIARLEMQNGKLVEVEKIESSETGRVRDVREAPDGSIWFLSVDKGAAYRLAPKGK